MDERRFDAITVLLACHRSRRETLSIVLKSVGIGVMAFLPTQALAEPKSKTLVCKANENPINPTYDKLSCVVECAEQYDSCFLCTMDEPATVSCTGFCCTAGVDCPGDPDEAGSFNANTKKEAKALCAKA